MLSPPTFTSPCRGHNEPVSPLTARKTRALLGCWARRGQGKQTRGRSPQEARKAQAPQPPRQPETLIRPRVPGSHPSSPPTSHVTPGKPPLPSDPAATSFLRKCRPRTRPRSVSGEGPPKGAGRQPRDRRPWSPRLRRASSCHLQLLTISGRAWDRVRGRHQRAEGRGLRAAGTQRVNGLLPGLPAARTALGAGDGLRLDRIRSSVGSVPSGGLPPLLPRPLSPQLKENTRIHI